MRRSVVWLALLGGLLGGCGEVLVAFDASRRADLRLDGDVTVTRHANGDQTVSGSVVNVGNTTADDVEVTLTTFVRDASGFLVPFETVAGVPVFDDAFGSRTLFPGERGSFAVLLLAPRPAVEEVDVEIHGRFPSLGRFLFFLFTPGVVIIIEV